MNNFIPWTRKFEIVSPLARNEAIAALRAKVLEKDGFVWNPFSFRNIFLGKVKENGFVIREDIYSSTNPKFRGKFEEDQNTNTLRIVIKASNLSATIYVIISVLICIGCICSLFNDLFLTHSDITYPLMMSIVFGVSAVIISKNYESRLQKGRSILERIFKSQK